MEGPKVDLPGFFDPNMREPKRLRIHYIFSGRNHLVEIDESMSLHLPSPGIKEHINSQNTNHKEKHEIFHFTDHLIRSLDNGMIKRLLTAFMDRLAVNKCFEIRQHHGAVIYNRTSHVLTVT